MVNFLYNQILVRKTRCIPKHEISRASRPSPAPGTKQAGGLMNIMPRFRLFNLLIITQSQRAFSIPLFFSIWKKGMKFFKDRLIALVTLFLTLRVIREDSGLLFF